MILAKETGEQRTRVIPQGNQRRNEVICYRERLWYWQ